MPSSVQPPHLSKRRRGRSPVDGKAGNDTPSIPLTDAQARIQSIPSSPISMISTIAPVAAPVTTRKRIMNVEEVKVNESDVSLLTATTAEPLPVARSLFGYPNTTVLRQNLIKSWEASSVRFRKRWNFDPETGLPCVEPHHRHRYIWTKVLPATVDSNGGLIVPPSPQRGKSTRLALLQQQAVTNQSHRGIDIGCTKSPAPIPKKFNASHLTQRSIKDYMRTTKGSSSAHCESRKKSLS